METKPSDVHRDSDYSNTKNSTVAIIEKIMCSAEESEEDEEPIDNTQD